MFEIIRMYITKWKGQAKWYFCLELVWPATTVFLNASGVKDGLAALEINCATFDESATSAENLGTH